MRNGFLKSALLQQERQATKLFLYLFYFISIGYDAFYYFVYPFFYKDTSFGFENVNAAIFYYSIQLALFFVSLYLFKMDRISAVKYLIFLGYVFSSAVSDIIVYSGSTMTYRSGNVVEVFMALFSPIFINSRFFWFVIIGTLSKYAIVGLIADRPNVVLPLMVIAIISIVAFILLSRFKGYIKALTNSYTIELEKIVKGIVATLELKDPYTRGHSERVAHYAYLLAERTGQFDREELQRFYQACLLHDIGKVNIPDQVLTKPGSLTNEEYEIIKTHTTVGAEVVKGIEGLEYSMDVVLSHHERWDGKGYPQQLKASEIPFTARIVSIADAFDAMTTLRSYRPALPSEEAYHRIVTGAGTQFDPQLVELYKEVFPVWQQFLNQTQWQEIAEIPKMKIPFSPV